MKIETTRPAGGNTGIVPPWLRKPPVITLPVEPATFISGERVTSAFVKTGGTVVCRVDRRHVLVRWDGDGMVRENVTTLRLEAGA